MARRVMYVYFLLLFVLPSLCKAGTILAIPDPIPEKIQQSNIGVELRYVAQINLSQFSPPQVRFNYLTHAADGSGRLFVCDMYGRILIIDNGKLKTDPFFDIRNVPDMDFTSESWESGLSSVAFHPDFNSPGTAGFGKIYTVSSGLAEHAFDRADVVTHVIKGTPVNHYNVIIEWRVDPANPDRTDPVSSRELMRFVQPYTIHDVGLIAFNPTAKPGDADYGMLYIAVGDGGHPMPTEIKTEPLKQAQKSGSPFGKILRINPVSKGDKAFTVPRDNPFINKVEYLPEIWALGLRNPQRFSWDPETGKMFITDIGASNIEEVNIGMPGANYGWSHREGTFGIDPDETYKIYHLDAANNKDQRFIDPIAQFDHDEGHAVTGGFVYRGRDIPELQGQYLFADFPSGRIFHIAADTARPGMISEIKELKTYFNGVPGGIKGVLKSKRPDIRFGSDQDGNIYILLKHEGVIYRISKITSLKNEFGKWYLYQDQLGKGSEVEFDLEAFEKRSVIHAIMSKPADPEPSSGEAYPYVGLGVELDTSIRELCTDCIQGIELKYRLSGKMHLLLTHEGVPPGQEYRVELMPNDKFITRFIPLESFTLPPWSASSVVLNSKHISGLKYQLVTKESSSASIEVSSIRLVSIK